MARTELLKTLTSFSGADLVVSFGPRVIGELQQISWAINREKAPVYTLGSADYRSVSRGKRGIAGSLIFAVFNRDALLEELKNVWDQIVPPAMFTAAGNISLAMQEDFEEVFSLTGFDERTSKQKAQYGVLGSDNKTRINVPAGFEIMKLENMIYIDQLPPFDVTMTFANEYGNAAFQKIYDVDLITDGSGVSVDTVVMERRITFIARRISPIIQGVYNAENGGRITNLPVIADAGF